MADLQSIKNIIKSRQFIHDTIRRKFGEQVLTIKTRELCLTCRYHTAELSFIVLCQHHLLPVTLNGYNCPYYELQDHPPPTPQTRQQDQEQGE